MENRRNYYRHAFSSAETLPVSLEWPRRSSACPGVILNLSVRGLEARLEDLAVELAAGEPVRATFNLPGNEVPFKVEAVVVHVRLGANGPLYGLQFQPLPSRKAQEQQEQTLWKFLLGEQRRLFRAARKD